MKKIVLLLVLSSSIVHTITAQETKVRRDIYRAAMDQQPLIIVDSVVTDFNHLLLRPAKIASMDVLKDPATISSYGEKGKYGVIIIRTRKNAEVVQLNELLNLYKVSLEDRKLRVCLDHVLIKDSNKLIADKEDIENVEVITDTCWISPTEAAPEERYINIVPKKR